MNAKRNIGDEIVQGMQEAVECMQGKKTRALIHKVKIPDKIDVKSIRKKLNLSRSAFADRFGFSSRTIQHWEQGSRRPQGAARVLLLLLQREPEIIEKILHPKVKTASTRSHTVLSARKVSSFSLRTVKPKKKNR